ncbi:MAG: T9SS type A sorting domain-containing protein [Ignavibacterium sp.]|nr:MAG: T9SS type A sorting domain-containing protein [Ignavibacterium sp.]
MGKNLVYILLVIITVISNGLANNALLSPIVLADSVAVTSPNGGETFQAGNTINILWFDDLVEPVKIELYKNDILHLEIDDNTPSDGTFIWNIPYDEVGGSDYKIKISSIQFTTKFDFSDSNFTIAANEVTITSPTANDNWKAGTMHSITWDANFENNVSIELLKGNSINRILSSSSSGSSFNWIIPFDQIGGSDYRIRVGSIINSVVNDTSDFFTITANQITITSPNGGELWYKDSTQTITWTDNISGDVKIELFEEDNLDDRTPIEIINQTESDGLFEWTVPTEIEPSTEYRVKITMLADEDIFDFSDTSFQFISELRVTSPNGGEIWLTNSEKTILYVDNFSTSVKAELYKGGTFYSLIDDQDNNGVVNWFIPDSLVPDNDYKIKVTSLNDPTSFDFSDNDFSIVKGVIDITSPSGGEYWLIGERYIITWNDNIGGNFKIELYKSDVRLDFIDDRHSGNTKNWTIPNSLQPDTDYKILITSLSDSTVFDFSDSSFTIALPQIEITTPNGGEDWRVGTTYSIEWTDIIAENVKIDLYRADTSYHVISLSTPSDGLYNWRIPTEIDSAHDYRIMVRSTANSNVVDFSDDPFSILEVPGDFTLSQNYPNPFNPTTIIRYGIPEDGPVLLEVFDIIGQRVLKLVDEPLQQRGFYEITFNRGILPSGVYIYRIISGDFVELKKMILAK